MDLDADSTASLEAGTGAGAGAGAGVGTGPSQVPSERCFICGMPFERSSRKSRRRVLRDRDDLMEPLMVLLYFATKSGTWFSRNEATFVLGPLSEQTSDRLKKLFSCRKCFEKVLKLQKDVDNFETEMSSILNQSFESLSFHGIIDGDIECMKRLRTDDENSVGIHSTSKNKKCKKSKKVITQKVTCLRDGKSTGQVNHHLDANQQIMLVSESGESKDGSQVLLLEVPLNEETICTGSRSSPEAFYAADHESVLGEEVLLSSSSIPVTSDVTVASLDTNILTQVTVESTPNEEPSFSLKSGNPRLNQQMNDNIHSKEELAPSVDTLVSIELEIETTETDSPANFSPNFDSTAGDSGCVNECQAVKSAIKKRKMMGKLVEHSLKTHQAFPPENVARETKATKKKTKRARASSPLPPAGESKIIVQLLYGSKQWKRNMEGEVKSIIRDLALSRAEPAGRKISLFPGLCTPVMKGVSKQLVQELKDATKTIKVSESLDDMNGSGMKEFTSEVFEKCPKAASFIKSLIPVDPRDTLDEYGATALILGIILYMHSMQSNTLQHILSLILRKAGCNREGFKQLHSLGLTLSYTSILKVMSDSEGKREAGYGPGDHVQQSIDTVVNSQEESKHQTTRGVSQDPDTLMTFSVPYFSQAFGSSISYNDTFSASNSQQFNQ